MCARQPITYFHPTHFAVEIPTDEHYGELLGHPMTGKALILDHDEFRVVLAAFPQIEVFRFNYEIEFATRRLSSVVFEFDLHVDTVIADGKLSAELACERHSRNHLADQSSFLAL